MLLINQPATKTELSFNGIFTDKDNVTNILNKILKYIEDIQCVLMNMKFIS
jgi:hypothetical protein